MTGNSPLNLPTALTMLRLVAVPCFVMWYGDRPVAMILFLGAMLTDALDGILARVMNVRTTLGAILDPLADKGMFLAAYVMMAWSFEIPWMWVYVVLARDVMIVIGWIMVYTRTRQVLRPTFLGKMTNVAQASVAIAFLFQLNAGYPQWVYPLGMAMLLLTIVSLLDYARRTATVLG